MQLGEIDKPALDIWTPVHFAVGALVGRMIPNRVVGYGLITIFEILEPAFWPKWRESKINIVTDLGVGYLGYEVGRASRKTRKR